MALRMVYVSPGPLDARAVEGLEEYQKNWPGRIVVVLCDEPKKTYSFEVVSTRDVEATVRSLAPDVIGALHRPEFSYLTELGKVVFTSEVDRKIRSDLQLVDAGGAVDRLRIVAGQFRREHDYRKMLGRAAGVQCNGVAAWKAYSRFNANPMFFQDHRIREDDLRAAALRNAWDGSRPLRVAFSGRLLRIKGADLLLEVARHAPHVDFAILGAGDLRETLESKAPENVRFLGFVPFDSWKPYMRENVDLALLPHRQGDPSMTYFEALGSGVPVLGFRNSTWSSLAEAGYGWAESNLEGLVSRLRTITPEILGAARERALSMMESYESVASRRVEHLLQVARLE